MLTIESTVPCDTLLDCWLHLYDVQMACLVQQSHAYERSYLAWETVRIARNPFFRQGTGFEGYFVGVCHSPEEMTDNLLKIGREVLASNGRMHPHECAFTRRMMETLRGEIDDAEAISAWATLLGCTLGKLRHNTCANADARDFQSETYRSVYQLPDIHYTRRGCSIKQAYSLAPYWKASVPKPELHLDTGKAEDDDAALVITRIGRFGHPLIRAYLSAANPNWWRNGWTEHGALIYSTV